MTWPGYHRLARSLFMDWTGDALCAKPGPWLYEQWFFADRNAENKHVLMLSNERKAKALCARCPVRKDCLEQGFNEEYGIWGGSLPTERSRFRNTPDRTDVLLAYLDDQAENLGLVRREGVA